jgi:hypothetical protein
LSLAFVGRPITSTALCHVGSISLRQCRSLIALQFNPNAEAIWQEEIATKDQRS